MQRKCMLPAAMALTLEQARYWWRTGIIDDTEWELYQFYWRNSAPRFSDECAAYELKV